MNIDQIDTRALLAATWDVEQVRDHLATKGVAVSTSTLYTYMTGAQGFPRCIGIYHPDQRRRVRRWLPADVKRWETPKVRRQRQHKAMLEDQLRRLSAALKKG